MTPQDNSAVAAWQEVSAFWSIAAVEHYSREHDTGIEAATEHFEELLKYLWLSATYPEPLTPSVQLDQMWHAFLIQTKEYASFSERLGKFVHHTTMSMPQQKAYSTALERYTEHFGAPPAVWFSTKCDLPAVATANLLAAGWCSDNDRGH